MTTERLLLDTHALLWALVSPEELGHAARQAIHDGTNSVLVSPASIYEINLKVSLGKLNAPSVALIPQISQAGFVELPLHFDHASLAGRLPFHHRDPFDRLLIAQAQVEDLTIVTRDERFEPYGVSILAC